MGCVVLFMGVCCLGMWRRSLIRSIFFMCSSSASSLMYMSIMSLFHFSSSLMSSLEIPLAAAETAAPFLIKWPEIWAELIPACRSSSLILLTKYGLLNGPYKREKRGSMGGHGWC